MDMLKKLRCEFPELFPEHFCDDNFSVPHGWENIVYELSRNIYNYRQSHNMTDIEVVQVKEKYHTFRYYLDGELDDNIRRLVEEAEHLADETCPMSGKHGVVTGRTPNGYVGRFNPEFCKENNIEILNN